MTTTATTTAWTEEDFDKKGMASALRRLHSRVRTESFFARRDRSPKSIGYLRILAAKLDHEGPEPVWDRMKQDYHIILTEWDEQVARIHERTAESIQEGEDTLAFIARGEVA